MLLKKRIGPHGALASMPKSFPVRGNRFPAWPQQACREYCTPTLDMAQPEHAPNIKKKSDSQIECVCPEWWVAVRKDHR